MSTKRKYAHELYPHPEEDEIRPLTVEVPYLYARAIGFDIHGTNWMKLADARLREAGVRTHLMIAERGKALLADALLQGLSGDEAWRWAEERNNPEGAEWVWQQAVHYGVDPDLIKPYECGGEPEKHDHYEPMPGSTWKRVIVIDGKESECADCCEPDSAAGGGHL